MWQIFFVKSKFRIRSLFIIDKFLLIFYFEVENNQFWATSSKTVIWYMWNLQLITHRSNCFKRVLNISASLPQKLLQNLMKYFIVLAKNKSLSKNFFLFSKSRSFPKLQRLYLYFSRQRIIRRYWCKLLVAMFM